ncbi:7b10040f-c1a9-4214-9a43-d6a4a791c977 [Thermothielavioides terrestris]|uniref:Glucosamine 6-phosphate N-acetyltransferase n=1 Tax=Thermothielavioides terrestris TaxID=2587410 RepID=A0A3S4CCA7_9PEZI|nr:7b10040f-c1a9-4214-9a43-d6a4a791c977 [Thermothielavioides terrestris]
MGTPIISFLEPTPLPWERALPPEEQPAREAIPRVFLDAMTVRSQVFVQEQHVPQSNEFDADDSRSAHWVVYASASPTQVVPIGTVRLVPFPHPPHPLPGGVYVDGELVGVEPAGGDTTTTTATTTTTTTTASTTAAAAATTATDRPTTFHDGTEPYVKLGRLAVIRNFRKQGIAKQLVRAAIDWMRQHPGYFDDADADAGAAAGHPCEREREGEQQGQAALETQTKPQRRRWRGLICCHAQVEAVRFWESCGFREDAGMGRWMEEGIPHVGMFLRVEVADQDTGGLREGRAHGTQEPGIVAQVGELARGS